jgi:hypothetical protein
MRLGPVLAAVVCAAGVTVSACSLNSTPPTARSLASKIGCTGFSLQENPTHYFHDIGNCYLTSSTYLTIMTFTSNAVRNQWLQEVQLGGNPLVVVTGNLWAVSTIAASGASAVQKALGGHIQNYG